MKEVILFLLLSVGDGWHDIREMGAHDTMEDCIAIGRAYQREHPEQVSGFFCRGESVSAEHHSHE